MTGGEGRSKGSGGERERGGGPRTPIPPGHNFQSYCHNFANDSQFQ